MKIESPGNYITRDGDRVEVIKVHPEGLWNIEGILHKPEMWKDDGSFTTPTLDYVGEDIIDVWPNKEEPSAEQLKEALTALLNAIVCDKDGDFFICQEDTHVITDAELLLNHTIKPPR